MKKIVFTLAVAASCIICFPANSQAQVKDSLGLPGDNFNLYAVLNIFQQCKTLEEFEKKLNSADLKVNNIDLNGDHKIDYIKVVDNMQGTAHDIVLKDEINENETQDVAVIEVQKDNAGKVSIQIVGDEELYGKNYIVEPKEQSSGTTSSAGTPNPGYSENKSQTTTSDDGKTTVINNTTNNYYGSENSTPSNNTVVYRDEPYEAVPVVVYPVATWYMWDFLFAPTYVVYVSPYRWHYYPSYWDPWEPIYYHQYYSYYYPYYDDRYYYRTNIYRSPEAHNYYYGHRRSTSATVVHTRTSGGYNTTYSRRDLLTKPAATGIRTNKANASPGERNEPKSVPENTVKPREQMQQNNQSKENTQRNNNFKGNQPANNNEQRNNPQNNNNVKENPPRNNSQQGNSQQKNNNNVNKPQNNNRPAPRPAQEEKRQPARQEAKPAPQNQNKGGGEKRK